MGLIERQLQIKKDINIAVDVWKELLQDIEYIEYIYVKGSAFKEWTSDIDYVPHISDLDIHVKLENVSKTKHPTRITPLHQESFELGYNLTNNYEKLFYDKCKEKNHESFHIPRIQIVQLNLHGGSGYNVPPRTQDITMITGSIISKPEFSHDKVRRMDKRNVLVEKDFLDSFAEKLFYLSSYEYFDLLYKITGKVSPFPARLLNQILLNENPHDIWTWNKTKIHGELIKQGFKTIAEFYKQYFLSGWKLFESKFQDTTLFREVIKNGFSVLLEVYNDVKNIE